MAFADDTIVVPAPDTIIAPTTNTIIPPPADTLRSGATLRTDSTQKVDPIYQGTLLKLDIASTVIELASHKGKVQTFEAAVSWRLKQRYYPVFEFGGANATIQPDSLLHRGAGGFFRAGVDINGFRRHPESLSAALVGVRIGTAMQSFNLTNYGRHFKADCWGEIVLGVQVDVYKGLLMGWNVRYRILFTRNAKEGEQLPRYIPGFGQRDEGAWGFNYYIGYKI